VAEDFIIIEEGKNERKPEPRRGFRLFFVAIGLLALFFLAGVRPYTDFLWFAQDAKAPEVFTLAYATKGTLFAMAFVVAVALYAFSFTRALGVQMVYLRSPQTMGEAVVANAIAWIQRHGPTVVKLAALILAFFAALSFSNEWQTWLVSRSAVEFGQPDPTFGRDLGFFVFTLPWWTALANFVFSLFLIGLVATFAIYFGLEFLATLGKIEVSKPFIRLHLAMLGAGLALSFAARLWLGRFEIGYVQNPLFTGGGYADQQRIWVQTVLAGLLAVVAVGAIANSRIGKPYVLTGWLAGGWGVLYVLGMWAYPAFVQRVNVEPNKISVESTFAERAMKMTRFGYGLDRIEERETAVTSAPTAAELIASRATLENMRLWDPDVLRETIEPIQSLRAFYRFHDVDIDRYNINGKPTIVMLSPRDVDHDGLQANARAWVNTKLQYTHGYGVVMTAVNAATSEGRPEFLIKDFPPKTPESMPIDRPQLYFSDARTAVGDPVDQYAIVGTAVKEFDYQSEQDAVFNTWEEPRGVGVSGLLSRLAHSVRFGDGNLLISTNITSKSKILYRRNVLERAFSVYPFLRFDKDPYIVLFEGRILWVLDAYTISNRIPYSAMLGEGPAALNYMRNSVKVTIDAYSGEMNAYAMEPDDPILKVYRKIYPRLVKDPSQVPDGLNAHFRYPEDLFMLQSQVLTQYHVKTPTSFLNNDDAWDLPVERGEVGESVRMKAYYVQVQLPGDSKPRFFLILPMTPRTKGNMSGWLAAHCDPDQYGKLVLFRYSKTSNTPGPAQMDARFNQDQEIANLNKLLNSDQSELVQGNLLVIPIGRSVLYVKPLFLRSLSRGVAPIPELRKVILATNDRIVVGNTYQEALDRLFGSAPTIEPPTDSGPDEPAEPDSASGSVEKSRVREALTLAKQADTALRQGDFAKYGELQKRLKALLEALAK